MGVVSPQPCIAVPRHLMGQRRRWAERTKAYPILRDPFSRSPADLCEPRAGRARGDRRRSMPSRSFSGADFFYCIPRANAATVGNTSATCAERVAQRMRVREARTKSGRHAGAERVYEEGAAIASRRRARDAVSIRLARWPSGQPTASCIVAMGRRPGADSRERAWGAALHIAVRQSAWIQRPERWYSSAIMPHA